MSAFRPAEWDEAARTSVAVRQSAAALSESALTQRAESRVLCHEAAELRRLAAALRAERKAAPTRIALRPAPVSWPGNGPGGG